jgi:tRNA-(ms[2]io[6]A)-hydroxylase
MSTTENSILGLKLPTDPRWVDLASISLEEILTDHAFCEQKAATQCISLIQLYPDKIELVNALSPIVTEEWGHFRMVWAEMQKRGYTLGRQRKDEYVNLLLQQEPKGSGSEEKLLNKLMICALIEARSCERFRLLSENLEDELLKKFYYKFMVSEAGHYRLFIDLAETYFSAEKVRKCWQQWLKNEENILAQLSPRGDRMH